MKEVNSGQGGVSPALPAANKLREVVPSRVGAGQALSHSQGISEKATMSPQLWLLQGPHLSA